MIQSLKGSEACENIEVTSPRGCMAKPTPYREALTRANDEVQKLLRESQRLAARHASERRDTEIDLSATNARIERLEAENRDAMVQIELLTAKGSLFDEVLPIFASSSINSRTLIVQSEEKYSSTIMSLTSSVMLCSAHTHILSEDFQIVLRKFLRMFGTSIF